MQGISPSTAGVGVLGSNTAASGVHAYGVLGRRRASTAPACTVSTVRTPVTEWACPGLASNPNGAGVQGLNTATSGVAFGVNGQTDSATGRGVRGLHDSTGGVGVGVEGETKSTTGVGVFGHAEAA